MILACVFSRLPASPSVLGVIGALYIGGATVASHYLMTLALGFEDAAVCAIVAAVEIPATYFLEFFVFFRRPTLEAAGGALLVLAAVVGVSIIKMKKSK